MKKSFWIAMGLLSLGVTACKDDVSFDQETSLLMVTMVKLIK